MRWVLKVGGSLCAQPQLAALLNQACYLSKSNPCTIVPGGGPFANQVRAVQKHSALTDKAAHRMALLAMRQYGYYLSDLAQLPVTQDAHQLESSCAVWLPSDDPKPPWYSVASPLPLDWDFSSDSISLCLANYIHAQWLVLLKSISVADAGAFSKLVDRRFVPLMQTSQLKLACVSPPQWLQIKHTDDFPKYQIIISAS